MSARLIFATLLFATSVTAPVAAQQQSQSYKFLNAIREGKNQEVVDILDQPGQTIVNTRDRTSGEGALHIVVKRGDGAYLRYLLSKGADINLRDGAGNTPLLLAVQFSHNALVDDLTRLRANANLANSAGETPLIRAVQKRDLTLVRVLMAAGADPDQADVLAGMSARDYARADTRSPAIAKLIEDTPKKVRRTTAGPRL